MPSNQALPALGRALIVVACGLAGVVAGSFIVDYYTADPVPEPSNFETLVNTLEAEWALGVQPRLAQLGDQIDLAVETLIDYLAAIDKGLGTLIVDAAAESTLQVLDALFRLLGLEPPARL